MRIKTILWVAGSAVALSSCNWDKTNPGYSYMDDMYRSPAHQTYEPGTAKEPAEGSVPRGYVPYTIPNTNEGYAASMANTEVPAFYETLDAEAGKQLYTQFCSHCHGEMGDGYGILMQREKILGIPGYGADKLPNITPGSIYHVIMYGKNNMGSHASQLNYEERWKIIKYVWKLRMDQVPGAAPAAADTTTAQPAA
ncbi:MAG: c-type cytochrome [Schleiferiaceae bacterium]